MREYNKYRKIFKKEQNLKWKIEGDQDEPLDANTKDENKEEHSESKDKKVYFDTDTNHATSISEKPSEKDCIMTLFKGSIEKYKLDNFINGSNVLKRNQ